MKLLPYISVILVLLVSPVMGEGWPTNYQHFEEIRSLAKGTPAWTRVKFTLNNGDVVFGQLLRYEKYTDYIWYQPQNTGRNWFKQDAFDVHELLSLEIVGPA